MEKYLLSDLLCLYLKNKDKLYLNEINRRMKFCGYTKNEISMFIEFESDIINNKTEKYHKLFTDKKYIIGKNKDKFIFNNIDNYMYNPNSNNNLTLLLSETLTIIDEAIFITYTSKLNQYNAYNEIISMSKENSSNWLFFEFFNRMEYICRCANNITNGTKSAMYNDKNNILYENEMQICIKRWNDIDISSRNFIPYTNEYYN